MTRLFIVVRASVPLLMALAMLALPATGQAGANEPTTRSLTVGGGTFPSSLHPMRDLTVARSWIQGLVYRGLFTGDRQSRLICLLCVEVPTIENGRIRRTNRPDGTKGVDVRFTLRPDAQWGDGTPVTSADFVLGWDVGRHPATGSSTPELYSHEIQGITVEDDRNFVVHRRSDGCSLMSLKDLVPLPSTIEGPLFQANPETYKSESRYAKRPLTPGIWNGPYRVRDVEPGISLTVERNPTWQGARPPLETITYRGFATSASREAALVSGRIDALLGEPGLQAGDAEALIAKAKTPLRLVVQPAVAHEHLDLNHDNPVLADIRVRRALLIGIDRPKLAREVFKGRAILSSSDIAPSDPFYVSPKQAPHFDPDEANRLLDEAGWKRGADGIRIDATGRLLTLDLITNASIDDRDRVMRFIAGSWHSLGITVRAQSESTRVLFDRTQPERKFQGAVLFSWRTQPSVIRLSYLHSSSIPNPENGFAGQNYGGYRNPRMDQVLEAQESACGSEEAKLWEAYQQLYAEDLPAIPLFFWPASAVQPVWLEGAEPTGNQFPPTDWVEQWRVLP